MKEIAVYCVNTGETVRIPAGSTLQEAARLIKPQGLGLITSAKVNNVLEGLEYELYSNKDVEFLGISSVVGLYTYVRSLLFVMSKAIKDVYPGTAIFIEAPISNGLYCEVRRLDRPVDDEVAQAVKRRMKEIIDADLPFIKVHTHTQDAIDLFRQRDLTSKARLLESIGTLYTTYYTLEGEPDYYYGALMPSTGSLEIFDVMAMADGLLLRIPDPRNPEALLPFVKQEKMLDVIKEHKRWHRILGVKNVGELNVVSGQKTLTNSVINVAEALQEKKIANIAEDIEARGGVKLVLIAGPSSSGKTTFSKRLSVQLMAAGIKPVAIAMDDYFVDRDKTPRDESGDYDFESLYALDIARLQSDLNALMNGEEVELPKYDFTTGKSVSSHNRLKIDEHTVIVMEGIHGLNPELTAAIPDEKKYKVFVSALTTIQLDSHNFIPTSDNRLLRRIVRDFKYRNYTAEDTISRWPKVLAGERKWIVPYQEEADVMFNSALLFELAGLRTQALPLLERVPECAPEYSEAYRLRKFLNYIQPIRTEGLPPTSLLREFLGGSTFHY
ncbi:MAG: nucleoside kinase [Bacteroidaceae bacterium]|nr:nucleoside kinase [Bacteroidaceae bacterium]